MHTSKLIFVADDDPDDRTLLEEALKELDPSIRLKAFDNGVTLMDVLLKNEELPAAIFLDLNMPLMNGEECLSDIRQETALAHLPVIIYSTYFDTMKVELLKEKGADLFLVKPVSFENLKIALKTSIDYIAATTIEEKQQYDFIIQY